MAALISDAGNRIVRAILSRKRRIVRAAGITEIGGSVRVLDLGEPRRPATDEVYTRCSAMSEEGRPDQGTPRPRKPLVVAEGVEKEYRPGGEVL
jgi:hypothetical protein